MLTLRGTFVDILWNRPIIMCVQKNVLLAFLYLLKVKCSKQVHSHIQDAVICVIFMQYQGHYNLSKNSSQILCARPRTLINATFFTKIKRLNCSFCPWCNALVTEAHLWFKMRGLCYICNARVTRFPLR